jgi:hypothetical protein
MANVSDRTQITVAIIGLIGVLAAALIANWERISPTHSVQSQSSQEQKKEDKLIKKTPEQPPQQQPEQAPGQQPQVQKTFGDDPDGVFILNASPPNGATLTVGQPITFTVTVRYKLTSLERATLVINLAEYPKSKTCTGSGHIPASGKVVAIRGERTITIPIQWEVGLSKSVTTDGSVGYGATFWSDISSGQMFRSFPLLDYCYSFQ